jgi:hypothetical protein
MMDGKTEPETARSALTSLPILGLIDGRTRPALAFKAAVADFISDLGGDAAVSRAELELIRRAAGLSVLAAQLEGEIVGGEDVNVERYVTVINAQRRVLVTFGLKRRARDVTPPLDEYLAARRAQADG